MPLADFCKAPVVTISPEEKVIHAAQLRKDKKVGSVIVVKEERPVGILTDRDIVTRVTADRKDASITMVKEVMTPNPVLASESVGVWELIQTMKKHGVRRFPIVTSDGKLVGVITMDDLVELIGEELSGLGRTIALELGQTEPAGTRK
jgi:CBS domain-containing protein